MILTSGLTLVAAGALMGFINNLAGAGGLIGLAALDLTVGLDSSTANAALRPAAVALTTAGMISFLRKGQRIPPRAWLYGLAAAPGAILGSLLAVSLPAWVYQAVLATVVTALVAQQLLGRSRARPGGTTTGGTTGDSNPPPQQTTSGVAALGLFSLVGLHMGFLQVAVGLLTILVLSRVVARDLVAINVAKLAVLSVTGLTSVISLHAADAIEWEPALWLAGGAAIGSFVASSWSVRHGHGAIRVVVLSVCVLMLVRLLIQLGTS